MKQIYAIATAIALLSGCTIGNGHICGPQTPAAYCDREAYEKLMHPKPYIEKWERQGATSETRDQDSANCGGGSGSHAPGFSQKRINEEKRPGENENAAYSRLFDNWERCMIKKGYRFTGKCYDNEISRASPACGAP
ncbi:hypothetical protein [Ralstonia pseudosolanacearum]|uniref:hypothetical protein n=1 Tax=Ralstonia pseudosolanacearum TaxID=1310165 RepID=UPI001FF7B16D|nr:hypothetical protein [Ralstonia pseudosolanacearum]